MTVTWWVTQWGEGISRTVTHLSANTSPAAMEEPVSGTRSPFTWDIIELLPLTYYIAIQYFSDFQGCLQSILPCGSYISSFNQLFPDVFVAQHETVSKSVSLLQEYIYIFQFKLFSQSLTTWAWTCGGAAAELARIDPACQSNEGLAAAPRSASNHLLMWKRKARLICFGWIWIQTSTMLIMSCGNWSRALYEQRIGAKWLDQSRKYIGTFKNIVLIII